MRIVSFLLPTFLAWISVVQAAPLVFAAASLTDALTAVGDEYAKAGHEKPVFSFAASSALARQIEKGAPAALFVSADEQWMDYLSERKLLAPGTRTDLLGNRLVLIAPAAHPMTLTIEPDFPLERALDGGKLALADPDAVPAGKYAKAALTFLGLWDAVAPSVVRADNVRAALAFVERGEANAGVVYATDAAVAKNVVVAGVFPEASHPPIRYPAALIGAKPDAEAQTFFVFLQTDAAKAVFRSYGFSVK